MPAAPMRYRMSGHGPGMIGPLYFLLGAFSLVFQTLLLREFFTVAAGNEISFAVALGAWMLGVGAGSLWAGFLSAGERRRAHALPWVVLAMCVNAPLLLAGVRCLQQISAVPAGALIPLSKTFWLIPLLTIPFSFCSGFAFPQAGRLAMASTLSPAQKMVRAYAWECIGALAGGMLYSFWLLEKMNPVLIIACFTLLLLTGSAFAVMLEKRKKALAVHMLLLVFNLVAILGGGAVKFDSWLVRQRWRGLSNSTWVESRDSKFQNLQLGLSHGQYCLYGNGQLAAVFPDDDQHQILAAQIITQHPRPRRVLVIGDGASGLAAHLLQYEITSLTVVEIDGEFLELVGDHLPAGQRHFLHDPRLRMPVLDGRRFVMEAARSAHGPENRFDLVFLQQPDAWTARLNRYYTREFFMDLRAILNWGGVTAMRLTSAENYVSEITNPYTATIYQTLKSVFPVISVSPGPTSFLAASWTPDSVSSDPRILAERYKRLARPPADLQAIFISLYPEQKTGFIKKALDEYPPRSLNRDHRPIAYFLCSRLLGWTSGSPLSGWFDFFEKVEFRSLFVILSGLCLLMLLRAVLRRHKAPGNFSLLLASAAGGFAGLCFEILTIFYFQNIWGYVYQAIGLLIAAFMLGMGTGAVCLYRYLEKKPLSPKKARNRLAAIQLLIAVAGLTGMPLMKAFARMAGGSGQITLFFWLGGIGFLIGAILPLALYSHDRQATAAKAGFLIAADYLGGAIGALAAASFLLPLYGSANSMLLVAVPALTAALLLRLEAGFNGPGPS